MNRDFLPMHYCGSFLNVGFIIILLDINRVKGLEDGERQEWKIMYEQAQRLKYPTPAPS